MFIWRASQSRRSIAFDGVLPSLWNRRCISLKVVKHVSMSTFAIRSSSKSVPSAPRKIEPTDDADVNESETETLDFAIVLSLLSLVFRDEIFNGEFVFIEIFVLTS